MRGHHGNLGDQRVGDHRRAAFLSHAGCDHRGHRLRRVRAGPAADRLEYCRLPAQVHLHAAVFFGWIILYVAQNWLVDRGSIAMHRRLGVATACLIPVMVVVGVATTVMAVRLNRVPPFFTPGLFLALDLQIIGFAILAGWAIQLRHRSDWHKRLMLCATILIMSPALGRILPMPLMGPSGTWAIFIATMAYLGAAMLFDAQLRGRVHLALLVGRGNADPRPAADRHRRVQPAARQAGRATCRLTAGARLSMI
ncbi:hypothetical protein QP185_03720 [Sphingomonas aerolata]|uniref:hypothetical protein n=1 Tax=Sphingomonas aerolata TaxID=185951 RepID=UPI002FE35E16